MIAVIAVAVALIVAVVIAVMIVVFLEKDQTAWRARTMPRKRLLLLLLLLLPLLPLLSWSDWNGELAQPDLPSASNRRVAHHHRLPPRPKSRVEPWAFWHREIDETSNNNTDTTIDTTTNDTTVNYSKDDNNDNSCCRSCPCFVGNETGKMVVA